MLANNIIKYRLVLALIWCCLLVVLVPQVPKLKDRVDVSSKVESSQASQVQTILKEEFSGFGGRQVLLIIKNIPDPSEEEGDLLLVDILDHFETLPWVTRVDSPLNLKNANLLHTTDSAIAVLSISDDIPVSTITSELRKITSNIKNDLSSYPDTLFYVTGEQALDYDLKRATSEAVKKSELIALPLVLLLLIWIFGSLTTAMLPVLFGCAAMAMTLGTIAIIAQYSSVSLLAQSITSLLGLALGTDYALLMVARLREELSQGASRDEAVRNIINTAGRTICLSGMAVAIGFGALLIVPVSELRSIGVAGILVTSFSVLLATTLMPSLLLLLGDKLNFGKIRKSFIGTQTNTFWKDWGQWITQRPSLALLTSLTILLLLAYPIRNIQIAIPDQAWLPANKESVIGLKVLEEMGKAGIAHRFTILLKLPDGITALSPDGWAILNNFQSRLVKDPQVEVSVSLPWLIPKQFTLEKIAKNLPEYLGERFLSNDRQRAIFEVVPNSNLKPSELIEYTHILRDIEIEGIAGTGSEIHVGGMAAATTDYLNTMQQWFPVVIVLVVIGTLIALFAGFQSVLIPIKAVILNLLTVAATFGIVQLVFMQGYGSALFGLEAPLDGVFPSTPFLVFCAVFGISMDYEIFLIARVAQAHKQVEDEQQAIAEGITRTAQLITSAALIMFAVFISFTIGDFLPPKILGFSLAVAVLLDATIVRMVLSPALLCIAGKWNWWPRSEIKVFDENRTGTGGFSIRDPTFSDSERNTGNGLGR